jgi:hypothetical protein
MTQIFQTLKVHSKINFHPLKRTKMRIWMVVRTQQLLMIQKTSLSQTFKHHKRTWSRSANSFFLLWTVDDRMLVTWWQRWATSKWIDTAQFWWMKRTSMLHNAKVWVGCSKQTTPETNMDSHFHLQLWKIPPGPCNNSLLAPWSFKSFKSPLGSC